MAPNNPQRVPPIERKPELEIGLAKKDDRLVGCYGQGCKEMPAHYFYVGPFCVILCHEHLVKLGENIQKALAPHTAA